MAKKTAKTAKSSVAVAAPAEGKASYTPRQPNMSKWKLVQFYCFFVFVCGGAFVLFDPTAVKLSNGKFQLLAGLLTLLLVLLLMLPSKPLAGSRFDKVSRIHANKNRLALEHQKRINASKKRR